MDFDNLKGNKSFGNARYVRSKFEAVKKNQALRIVTTINNPTPEELSIILPSQIPFVIPSDTKGIQQP